MQAAIKRTGRAALSTVGTGLSPEGIDWYTTPYPIYTRQGDLIPPSAYASTVPEALVKATVTLVSHLDRDHKHSNAYFDVQEVTILETREERLAREWDEGEPHRRELEDMFARIVASVDAEYGQ